MSAHEAGLLLLLLFELADDLWANVLDAHGVFDALEVFTLDQTLDPLLDHVYVWLELRRQHCDGLIEQLRVSQFFA